MTIQSQLNECFLNVVLNGVLFSLLILLFLNSILDQREVKLQINRNFSAFVFCSAIYVGLMVIFFPIKEYLGDRIIIWILNFLRITFALAAYTYISAWLYCIIGNRNSVTKKERKFLLYFSHGVLFLTTALILLTGSTLIANIPIVFYYAFLEVLTLRNSSSLGKEYAWIITMLIIPEFALTVQTWWNYTPANIYLVMIIMVIYNRMWLTERKKLLNTEVLLAQKEAQLENERTKLVLSQIKPHFIYNTMSTITYLCGKNPKAAQNLSMDFTDYLRGNLIALDSPSLVPFEKELEHVRTYLKIEQVRFSDALKVEYDIKVENFSLPVLTVEPLVENAVKHGIRQKNGGGTVCISSYERGNGYFVIVSDDGIGFDISTCLRDGKEHIGLRSVKSRMENLCNGSFRIESTPGLGTKAELFIPKMEITS